MLAADRDALICDLAETYHVLDLTALPVPLLATLAAGLRGDSRIRSVLDAISGKEEQSDSKPVAYNTPADFERARTRILKRER